MTALRIHLNEGFVELLDSFGNLAVEWHDRKYMNAVGMQQVSEKELKRVFESLAIKEGYIVKVEGNMIAAGSANCLFKEILT